MTVSDGSAVNPVRCFDGDATMREYHDHEWGRPVLDERGLYERICLEAFQSGLSWSIVLRKRQAFREAFAGFDPDVVAAFSQADIDRISQDPGVIRNRAKIVAAIENARSVCALRNQGTSLVTVVWSFHGEQSPAPHSMSDVPGSTVTSAALARTLKGHGFRFVGPTTAYALMQAVGVVNDHLADCIVRGEVESARMEAVAHLHAAS